MPSATGVLEDWATPVGVPWDGAAAPTVVPDDGDAMVGVGVGCVAEPGTSVRLVVIIVLSTSVLCDVVNIRVVIDRKPIRANDTTPRSAAAPESANRNQSESVNSNRNPLESVVGVIGRNRSSQSEPVHGNQTGTHQAASITGNRSRRQSIKRSGRGHRIGRVDGIGWLQSTQPAQERSARICSGSYRMIAMMPTSAEMRVSANPMSTNWPTTARLTVASMSST